MSKCIPIKDGILCVANPRYQCPHCNNIWYDRNDVILNKIHKEKYGYTKATCEKCEKKFYMTYDFKGDFQTWK